jgi:hypothetical protein
MARLKVPRVETSADPFAYGGGWEEACGAQAGLSDGIGWFRSWCD